MKIIYLLNALVVAAAVAAPVAAENEPDMPGRDAREQRFAKHAESLGLTAEQREKFKALREGQRERMAELHSAMQAAREEFSLALDAPDATPEKVAPLAAKVKEIAARMIDERVNAVFAAKNILTPEQFAKLQELQPRKPHPAGEKRGCRPFWMDIKLKGDKGKRAEGEGNAK